MIYFNAFVTLDANGRLFEGSTVTVYDVVDDVPVPLLADAGGIMFWPRIRAALLPHNLRPGPGSIENHLITGRFLHFNAVPRES